MVNIIIISRKELSDLLGNKWVLISLFIYLLMVLSFTLNLNSQTSINMTDELLFPLLFGWSKTIMNCCTIIGIMIGFSMISSEKFGKALNILVTKPLYRDTIINGKIIACVGFLLIISGLTVVLYISSMLIVHGVSSAQLLMSVLYRMPVIFLISFLYVLIFTLLSMLFSIIVKRQSVALLLSILIYVLLLSVLPSVSFAGNIYYVLGAQVYYPLANLFPDFAYNVLVMQGLYDPDVSVYNVISANWADFIIFPLYVFILIVLCYASFLRRDIT